MRELHFRQGQIVRPDPDFRNGITRLISSIEKSCGNEHELSSSSSERYIDPEFIEVVKHRAELVLAYIKEQELAALADSRRDGHSRRSESDIVRWYQQAYDLYLKLQLQYLKALEDGKTQVAHEVLGDIYQLVYRCRHEQDREPPRSILSR